MKYIKQYEAFQMYKPEPDMDYICKLIHKDDNGFFNYIIGSLNRGHSKDRIDDFINNTNSAGETMLYVAVSYKNMRVIDDLLISDNIDINKTNDLNQSPLMVAAGMNFMDIVDMLLERPEIDVNIAFNDPELFMYKCNFLDAYILLKDLNEEPTTWLTYDKQKYLLQKWPNLYDTLKKYPKVIDPKIVEENEHLKNELF